MVCLGRYFWRIDLPRHCRRLGLTSTRRRPAQSLGTVAAKTAAQAPGRSYESCIQSRSSRRPQTTLLIAGWRSAALLEALDDVGRDVPRQNLGLDGFATTDLQRAQLGAAPCRLQRLPRDLLHRCRLAVGLELQLICPAVLVGRDAGNRLDLLALDVARLLAQSARRLDPRHAHAAGEPPLHGS